MVDQLVCNINIFFYMRFFIGYYHEFQTTKRVKLLARLYCVVVSATFVFFLHYFHADNVYPIILVHVISLEYLLYVIVSLINSNKYLLKYYSKTPLIDTSPSAYKLLPAYLIGCICVMSFLRFLGFVKSILYHIERSAVDHSFDFLDFLVWINILNGRAPLLFVFALLYSRIRVMRQTLENNNFDCKNQSKHHPRRYIHMYQAIMDGLEKSNDSVKPQLFVSTVFSSAYNMFAILYALYLMRHSVINFANTFEFLWFILEITLSYSPLYLSAILADLVSLEIHRMLVIVMGRRINCKDDRDREEIHKLFHLLKRNPFKYSLWHLIPLNVRSLVTFVSFTVTTVIAILQIQGLFT